MAVKKKYLTAILYDCIITDGKNGGIKNGKN